MATEMTPEQAAMNAQTEADAAERIAVLEKERDTLRAQLEPRDSDSLRYSFMWDADQKSSGMFPFPSGEWVKWEDYCALRAQLEQAENALGRAYMELNIDEPFVEWKKHLAAAKEKEQP